VTRTHNGDLFGGLAPTSCGFLCFDRRIIYIYIYIYPCGEW